MSCLRAFNSVMISIYWFIVVLSLLSMVLCYLMTELMVEFMFELNLLILSISFPVELPTSFLI